VGFYGSSNHITLAAIGGSFKLGTFLKKWRMEWGYGGLVGHVSKEDDKTPVMHPKGEAAGE
jgi:hypothetical protein